MSQDIYKEFVDFMNIEQIDSKIDESNIERFKGKTMLEKDKDDIVYWIWKNKGRVNFKNGLFSIVDPNEYNDIAKKFPDVSEEVIVFAKTATGCLFTKDKFKFGEAIFHLNVHTGEYQVADTSICMFFEWKINTKSYWDKRAYGKIEFAALEKHGPIEYDECYTFVPALALGGSESVAKMEKVKVKENLELLAQLHQE